VTDAGKAADLGSGIRWYSDKSRKLYGF